MPLKFYCRCLPPLNRQEEEGHGKEDCRQCRGPVGGSSYRYMKPVN
jgi:hypothetical protein